MKLILCTKCNDIFKIHSEIRKCRCGNCSGQYINNTEAWYKGKTVVPIGIDNSSLSVAVRNWPEDRLIRFDAFVFEKNSHTFKNKGE